MWSYCSFNMYNTCTCTTQGNIIEFHCRSLNNAKIIKPLDKHWRNLGCISHFHYPYSPRTRSHRYFKPASVCDHFAERRKHEMNQDNSSCFRFPVFQTENVPQLLIVLNCGLNMLLLLTTILGNVLVLAAVWRTPSLRSPSNIFLCGLATTDLAVGVVVQPLFLSMELILLRNSAAYHCALENAFITVSYTVCGASLITITSISVDRLLALRFHMRYSSIVTVPKVLCVIMINWLTSGFLASLILWSANIVFPIVMAVAVAICLCVSTSAHASIFQIVRRHKQEIKAQAESVQQATCINLRRFRRTSSNAFLVHYFLLACYTPLFVTLLLTSKEEQTSSESWRRNRSAMAWKLASTVVFMNSTLNPFIYCWRLRDIRTAVKKAFFCRKWL